MNYFYFTSLLLPLLFNRWRGTGIIFTLFNYEVSGSTIYGIYYSILFGLLTNNPNIGVLTFTMYLMAEHPGFGKWVGYLTSDNGEKEYNNTKGTNFPYISQTAELFVKQKDNYELYCQIALFLRGLYWALPLYLVLYKGTWIINYITDLVNLIPYVYVYNIENVSYIDWQTYLAVSLFYAVGFPLACYLGKITNIEYKSKYLNLSKGWENQEVYYGLIHSICNIYVVYYILINSN